MSSLLDCLNFAYFESMCILNNCHCLNLSSFEHFFNPVFTSPILIEFLLYLLTCCIFNFYQALLINKKGDLKLNRYVILNYELEEHMFNI